MNKTPITIWVELIEPTIENNKIIVKKGEFYYNKHKYTIENGIIYGCGTAQFADNNHSTIQ